MNFACVPGKQTDAHGSGGGGGKNGRSTRIRLGRRVRAPPPQPTRFIHQVAALSTCQLAECCMEHNRICPLAARKRSEASESHRTTTPSALGGDKERRAAADNKQWPLALLLSRQRTQQAALAAAAKRARERRLTKLPDARLAARR